MIKAVVFDFDYTLGDSTQGIALSINYALGQLDHASAPVEEIRKTIGLPLKKAYVILTGNTEAQRAEAFTQYFKEKADQVMTDNTVLYAGVREMLEKLRGDGCKTAIVTTKFRYRIEAILKKYAAEALFDAIVGSENVKVEKPDPEGLLWTIDHLGLSKADVLYVGDSLVDAQTAANAGVRFAAVLTGTTTREDFAPYPCVHMAKSAAEIYDCVKAL